MARREEMRHTLRLENGGSWKSMHVRQYTMAGEEVWGIPPTA